MRHSWSFALLVLACGSAFAEVSEPPPPPPPALPSESLPPECSARMSVLYQPPQDALIAMLDARTDIPANTYFRLALSYAIDADGVPADVSIVQSSQDRDLDQAAIAWGRDVRFSSAPGCRAKRHGVLPMILLP